MTRLNPTLAGISQWLTDRHIEHKIHYADPNRTEEEWGDYIELGDQNKRSITISWEDDVVVQCFSDSGGYLLDTQPEINDPNFFDQLWAILVGLEEAGEVAYDKETPTRKGR